MLDTIQQIPENSYRDFTLLIPVLNESGNIGELLSSLAQLYPELKVMVVDDESTDGTQGAVLQAANLLTQLEIQLVERVGADVKGITASVLDGLSRVTTRYFMVMDGDLQHPVNVVAKIIAALRQGDDLCIATRLPYKENQGLHRIFVTRVATGFARLRLQSRGFQIQDPMSGFFGGKVDLFRRVFRENSHLFEFAGYKVLFDFLQALPSETRLSQPTYQFAIREEGTSKLRPIHAFYFLRSVITSFSKGKGTARVGDNYRSSATEHPAVDPEDPVGSIPEQKAHLHQK